MNSVKLIFKGRLFRLFDASGQFTTERQKTSLVSMAPWSSTIRATGLGILAVILLVACDARVSVGDAGRRAIEQAGSHAGKQMLERQAIRSDMQIERIVLFIY